LYFLAAWVLFFYLYFEYFRVGYYLNLLGWIVCVAACVSAMLFWASIVGGYGLPYRILTSRVLIFLGTISYSMYLWQTIVMYPLRYIVRSFSVEGVGAPAAYGIFVVSSLLITLIVSSLSYFLLEVRFARAMRRLMLPR
jgi:peptidoglycan/LPS O-acetylase OafA/YrhL